MDLGGSRSRTPCRTHTGMQSQPHTCSRYVVTSSRFQTVAQPIRPYALIVATFAWGVSSSSGSSVSSVLLQQQEHGLQQQERLLPPTPPRASASSHLCDQKGCHAQQRQSVSPQSDLAPRGGRQFCSNTRVHSVCARLAHPHFPVAHVTTRGTP